jgi:hypothetical protein
MSNLKAKKPNNTLESKAKIVVFGKAGIGKTWVALDFPNVYYIDVEGGATQSQYTRKLISSGGVYLGKDEGSQSFETVIEQARALATEKHEYKTLVIDSFSKLLDIEANKEVERLTANKSKIEYSIEKKPAIKLAKRLIYWLDKVDMNVILVCHSKAEYATVGGENKQIGNTFDGWEKIEYELDLCLEVFKEGASRKAFVRKTRIEKFEDKSVVDWSYDSFANRYGRQNLERETNFIVLATDEQKQKFREIFKVIKLSDSAQDKRVLDISENLEDESSETLDKVLTYLQTKIGKA